MSLTLLLLALAASPPAAEPPPAVPPPVPSETKEPAVSEKPVLPAKIIRKAIVGHCARGPKRCEKCKAMNYQRYQLLELNPPGDYARPVTEIVVEGKKHFATYDTLKTFESEEEARQYATEHNIPALWE